MEADGNRFLHELAPFDRLLEDGLAVRLRPVNPDDSTRIHRAYDLLSEESRLNRFWERSQRLGEAHVERLTYVDGEDHVAWIVLDPSDEGFPGFGGASYWREAGDRSRAEIAFTIADEWQRSGLATLLFSVLWFDGWHDGVRIFVAQCRNKNRAMRRWWADMGGTDIEENHYCRLSLDLVSPDVFLERIAYEVRPSYRLIETAEWLHDWIEVTGGSEKNFS